VLAIGDIRMILLKRGVRYAAGQGQPERVSDKIHTPEVVSDRRGLEDYGAVRSGT